MSKNEEIPICLALIPKGRLIRNEGLGGTIIYELSLVVGHLTHRHYLMSITEKKEKMVDK